MTATPGGVRNVSYQCPPAPYFYARDINTVTFNWCYLFKLKKKQKIKYATIWCKYKTGCELLEKKKKINLEFKEIFIVSFAL